MAKRYNIIMIISFLVFHIIFLAYAHSGFASRENEIIVKTYSILKAIGCAIKERWDHFPGSLPYPGNTDFCVDFIEAGKPCWNSPSIVGSTRPMLEYLNIGSEPSAELDNFVKEHM
ncbi:MAG TPA: hypothetical protein PLO93_05635, partial [Candidatus Omnitrophota bacterium]|nr:hypothetical protein [Candidatus Omnitrophota bacterium]